MDPKLTFAVNEMFGLRPNSERPETQVTFRTGQMGDTFRFLRREVWMPWTERVVFYKEELLFRWSDAETGISGIERDKELLLREVFVNS